MTKKSIFITLGAVAVFIAVLLGLKSAGVIGDNEDVKTVEITKVNQMTIIETVSATGKIQPEVEIKISSEVSGEVIALPIKEGQQVKKGDLLVKINPDIYVSGVNRTAASVSNTKAGLSQAEAQVKEAKANFDRNKKLFDKGVISKSEWDRIVSTYEVAVASKQSAYYNVQSASATLTEARDNLGRTTIYAPADGTISLLSVELGERVLGTQQMAGTEILRVANLNHMEVEVDVNENDIVKVSVGDSAKIEVDAYLKREFKMQKVINLHNLPLIYKQNLTKEKIRFETSFISTPILFRNNTMAIYYNTQTYGGSLTLLQKRNSKWEIICSSSVWIE